MKPQTPTDEPTQTGLVLYGADREVINAALGIALTYQVRLSMGQVIRMLVRVADLSRLKESDFRAALEADDGRRKKSKDRGTKPAASKRSNGTRRHSQKSS